MHFFHPLTWLLWGEIDEREYWRLSIKQCVEICNNFPYIPSVQRHHLVKMRIRWTDLKAACVISTILQWRSWLPLSPPLLTNNRSQQNRNQSHLEQSWIQDFAQLGERPLCLAPFSKEGSSPKAFRRSSWGGHVSMMPLQYSSAERTQFKKQS